MINNPNEGSSPSRPDAFKEYSRILTAAVISSQFRQMLLSNPAKAIADGFGGEAFCLESEDRKRVASIRANTLADFAIELNRIRSSRTNALHAVAGD